MEESSQEKGREMYRRFQETGQEKIKLETALEGFFTEPEGSERREAYGKYLKRRIRPAVEALIRLEDVDKIEALEQQGWFGAKELEGFLQTARTEKKLTALAWLLELKDEKYGYEDRDFSL